MKPTPEQYNDFMAHRPVAGVTFDVDETVEIMEGEHAGERGVLSSLAELGEDTVYLVQLDSGIEAAVPQSRLRRREPDGAG
ncbi:hypothetical protein [Coralloluteibacterium thermophilus]|uniref:DUF4926 domain-containing protein n=1 Tax=Coralloluteibacterium thermophilum TaxID=2707049 RepID=A0ABV9NJC6_9GAMM